MEAEGSRPLLYEMTHYLPIAATYRSEEVGSSELRSVQTYLALDAVRPLGGKSVDGNLRLCNIGYTIDSEGVIARLRPANLQLLLYQHLVDRLRRFAGPRQHKLCRLLDLQIILTSIGIFVPIKLESSPNVVEALVPVATPLSSTPI